MKQPIINPITKDIGVLKKVNTFDVVDIIKSYKSLGLEVERFFENLKTIELYECLETNYRFFYPFSCIGDAQFYKDLSLNRPNYYSTRWEHLKILPSINPSDRVLEIGSGFGIFLKLLKSKSIKAEGLELNPEAINICLKHGLNIHNELIEEFAQFHESSYEIVCYFQVLEHITDVRDFIQNSLIPLKPNGRLIIGVPNNNPFLFINDKYHTLNLPPHHAGLWNVKSLKALEKIFPIVLETVYFEPLEKTYNYFLSSYMANTNSVKRQILKVLNKYAHGILKRFLCRFISGRNILVVFRKINNE